MRKARQPALVRRAGWILLLLASIRAAAVLAGEGGDETPTARHLTAQDLTLLQMLVERKLEESDLADDERRLYERVDEHLGGTAPAPLKRADLAEVRSRLRELLRARVASAPEDRQRRMALARFYLYEDDPEKALIHLLRVGPASEDDVFWPMLTSYAYLRLGEHRKAADFLARTRDAATRIVPLHVRRVIFCNRVDGLGQYDPRTPRFRRGEATWVYVELNGAGFRKTADDDFRLDISIDLEIRDHVQETAWEQDKYSTFPFTYQHRVHAVFGIMELVIPRRLGPGKHTLVVEAEDREAGQRAVGEATFTIIGGK
jgi:hypothetical protein